MVNALPLAKTQTWQMPKNLQQLELFMQSGVGRPQPWWTVMLRDPH